MFGSVLWYDVVFFFFLAFVFCFWVPCSHAADARLSLAIDALLPRTCTALPLVRAHQARAQASGGPPSPSAELEFDPDDEELDLDSDLVLAAEELRGAATALGNVTGLAAGAGPGSGAGAGVGMGAGMGMGTMGAVRVEEVLGEIFGRFCIGK